MVWVHTSLCCDVPKRGENTDCRVLEQYCPYNKTEPGRCYLCAYNRSAPFYPDIFSRYYVLKRLWDCESVWIHG